MMTLRHLDAARANGRGFSEEVEPIWRHEYIDYIEVTAAETAGFERCGAFEEPTGAKLDLSGFSTAFCYEDAFKQEPNVRYETLFMTA